MRKKGEAKKNVYLNYWKLSAIVAIGCIAVFGGLIAGDWVVAIFFSALILFSMYPLYNPRVKVIWIGTEAHKEALAKEIEENSKKFAVTYADIGNFIYSPDGFTLTLNNKILVVKWGEVICMVGYKRDDMTTDCICLDVHCDNDIFFIITEDMPGWFQFVIKTKEQFPQINKMWDGLITVPAFKKNLTLVYDRENRSLADVMKLQYPKK